MATKFIETGGDATQNAAVTTSGGFWGSTSNALTAVGDFMHGNHLKSLKPSLTLSSFNRTPAGVLADSGGRFSVYLYINALGSAISTIFLTQTSVPTACFGIRITSGGVLQVWNGNTTNQIGSSGSTLSAGKWYRVSCAYTITSGSVNEIRTFLDGVADISITNATITTIATSIFTLGNVTASSNLDIRYSDIYVDTNSSLADPGNIWVTAKRPNANGTTNNFVTQIGSTGSGYGSGHSPQVNERPISTTNGWSVVAVGATTEEYNIEGKSVGDIDISQGQIVDYVGWVYTSALASETGQIIVNNVTSNISITSTSTVFTAIAGSTTYPSGTGTDIGMVTSATATTVSLYECGVMVAYIPTSSNFLSFM